MKLPLNNLKIIFLFLFSFLALNGFAQEKPDVWTKVSLTKEDTLGANTLMVLVRNADRFAKFIAKTGGPLNDSAQIAVRKDAKSFKKYEKSVKGVITRTNTDESKYILAEKKADGSIGRILVVDEQVRTTVFSKKVNPKDPNSAENLVPDPSEPTPKGETSTEYARRIKPRITRKYPAALVDVAKLDSKTLLAYEKAFATLDADSSKPVSLAPGVSLSLVSAPATLLIKKASQRADSLADEVAAIGKDGKFDFDEVSPKTVSFLENQKGQLKDVTVSGLVCLKGQEFEAPDARSAWVLTLNAVPGKSTELVAKLEERKATEAKADFNTLKFETK